MSTIENNPPDYTLAQDPTTRQKVMLLDCGHWHVTDEKNIIKNKTPDENPFQFEGNLPCPFCRKIVKVCRSMDVI